MRRFLKSIIKRAVVALSLDDGGDYPTTQISYLDKTSEIEVLYPYGLAGRLPKDSLVVCFNVEGSEDNKTGIGNTPTIRFKNLEEGEVTVGNPLTRSKVYFKANGDIEVIGKNDKIVTIDGDMNIAVAGNVTITAGGDISAIAGGDASIVATGNANMQAGGVATVLAPAVQLGASGGTLRKLVDARFISLFNSHTHGGIASGGATSGTPSVPLVSGGQETSDTGAS